MKTIFINTLLVLITIIASSLALEGSYRLYKIVRYGMANYVNLVTVGAFESDPLYGLIPKKQFDSESIPSKIRFSNNAAGIDKLFTFNGLGYRGKEFSVRKDRNTYRIITFGGSTTMSIGSSDLNTWSAKLGQMLQHDATQLYGAKNVEVINAGVGNWRSREGLLRFQLEARHFEPDLILVAFNWNDVHEGLEGLDPDKPKLSKKRWWLCSAVLQNFHIRYLGFRNKSVSSYKSKIKNMQRDKYWARRFEQNILEMQDIASGINARIVLVKLPGLCREEADALEKEFILNKTRVNASNFPYWVKLNRFVSNMFNDLSREHEMQMVDVHSFFNKFSGMCRVVLFTDEMHFSEEGSEEVAKCIYSSLI